jgi:hypothetical protein
MNTLYKNILASVTLLVLIMTVLTGCKDDEGSFNDVSVTPVNQFYEPANNRHVVLQSAGSMYFEWEKSIAGDNSIVYYDVLFDKADGDFSAPVYTLSSDNKGISNGATVPHKTLNKIAMLAGIELAEDGVLKWTVRASRGLNFSVAEENRTISLVRINSVDDLEGGTLNIAGEGASEAGQQLKPTGAIGEYEIYTKLEAGKGYHFTTTSGGTERTFVINSDNVSFKETLETPAGATVSESGVYRIHLDFGAAAATVQKVSKVEIVVSWTQRRNELSYASNGVWELIGYNVQLAEAPWGFDERYKIVFTVDGAEQHWGQKGPHFDDRPSINRPGYRDMAPTEGGQWGGSQFKFPSELADGTNLTRFTVDLSVSMTVDKNYTHDFTNVRE